MRTRRFKVGPGALALVVVALWGSASQTDLGLTDAVGTGGLPPGTAGAPGSGGDVGGG